MAQESSGGWEAMLGLLAEIREWSDTLEKQHVFFSAALGDGQTAYETNPAGLSENITNNCSRG